jgi:hypothetical protein
VKRLALGLLLCANVLWAQEAPKPKSTVLYLSEQQTVPAGKQAKLELRFKVLDGYHVNSHRPKSEFLIATAIKTQPASGVTVGEPVYSAGREFSFSFSPEEKLDVYTGQFTVMLPVVAAAAGEHSLDGTLRYQACDKAACYPPKSLPLQILFTAK